MNTEEKTLIASCATAAVKVAGFDEATRTLHSEQLADDVQRARTVFDGLQLQMRLERAWHTFTTDRDSPQLIYFVRFAGGGLADPPKSAGQIQTALREAGLRVESTGYDAVERRYDMVLCIVGQARGRATRRLRHQTSERVAEVDLSALPPKIARQLSNYSLGSEEREALGLVRRKAASSVRISRHKRFSERRTAPKPVIHKRAEKRREASAKARASWFSLAYWFGSFGGGGGGGGGGGDAMYAPLLDKDERDAAATESENAEVAAAYDDEEALFAY